MLEARRSMLSSSITPKALSARVSRASARMPPCHSWSCCIMDVRVHNLHSLPIEPAIAHRHWMLSQSWLDSNHLCLLTSQVNCRKFSCRPYGGVGFPLASAARRNLTTNKSMTKVEREHLNWWEKKMEQLQKPSAKELTKRLNYTNLLGLDETLKNGSLKEGSLNAELLNVKSKFPREVLLCRIGEFYEAFGFDACILVEYASLNPMAGLRSDTVPRAGCPTMNLRQTLDALTLSGFSVCVYEEVKGPSQARQRKDRFVSGHAHPGSPYVYGLAEANIELDVPEEVFVVGVSKSARGYCLVSVLEMMRTYSVEEGLTEEAIVSKLRAKNCHCLFVHRSLRDDSSGLVRWGEYGEGGLLWGECRGKTWEWYDQDPVLNVLVKARELYSLDMNEEFREIVFPSKDRPRPLCIGTSTQIGILPTIGVPSLLKASLPADCPVLCHVYLRDLLLNPPPPQYAKTIQAACRLMACITTAIPDFSCVSAAKLVKLIITKEVNHVEFSRIRNMAEDVVRMHEDQQLNSLLARLLDPTSLATGLQADQRQLVADCAQLASSVNAVLAEDGDLEQNCCSVSNIPDEFFQHMESAWRSRVKRNLVESFYKEVENAAKCLDAAVEADFIPVLLRARASETCLGVPKAEIIFSREQEAVWLKLRNFSGQSASTPEEKLLLKALVPAVDAKGKKVKDDWYTTMNVERSLERYKEAVQNAMDRVYEVLRNLAEDSKSKLNTIVFISVLGIIGKTLVAHVSEASRRNWSFAELCDMGGSGDDDNKRTEPEFVDLIPYWVDKTQSLAVSNTVKMSSLYLLTGPNGGGKSSLLRSIGAASLLGMCGLMVPAASAIIPDYDAVMLRMMPHDSPADGKSAFQMEMSELQSILVTVTNRSLVLVDELCRGTEVQKGTAIAASVLEFLDSVGCTGFFSTHLHGILDMQLDVKKLVYKAMGTAYENGALKPSWKLVDGSCRESLAFETAKMEGVPQSVIERAEKLYMSNKGLCHCSQITKHDNVLESGKYLALSRNGLGIVKNTLIDFQSSGNLLGIEDSLSFDTGMVLNGNCSMKTEHQDQACGKPSTGNDKGTFDEVIHAFSKVCNMKLKEMNYTVEDELLVTRVYERERPPPAATNRSCVYLMHRPDGRYYIGQTDNIMGRIKAHRAKPGLQKALFAYVQVPNKSAASQLETFLINQLPRLGINLVNSADKHHKHFATNSAAFAQLPF